MRKRARLLGYGLACIGMAIGLVALSAGSLFLQAMAVLVVLLGATEIVTVLIVMRPDGGPRRGPSATP